jgi:hypothetical protein
MTAQAPVAHSVGGRHGAITTTFAEGYSRAVAPSDTTAPRGGSRSESDADPQP